MYLKNDYLSAMAFEMDMTEKTPEVLFDSDKGEFSITGILMPEDAVVFFRPLFQYISDYFENPKSETTLTIDLEYFNTTSSRMLYQFMKTFSDAYSEDSSITIIWKYEADDPDMEEAGDEYALLFEDVDFKMIPIDRPKIYKIMGS